MKWLADMGISPQTVAFLRNLGHDATHLSEHGLGRMTDPDILAKARQEGRILLTHDLDFANLMAAGGHRLPSVIIFRLRHMRPERVNLHLHRVIKSHADSLEKGVIISLTEYQIRLRTLPLGESE